MKGKLTILLILVGVCIALSVGSGGVARAQQGEDRGPGLDRSFNLDSYQGSEEMPYYGEAPAVDQLAPINPYVYVPYSKIVFQSFRNLRDWNIFISDGDGSNQTQLTWGASSDIHPRINRGCTRIVFASNSSGNYEIYTMNLDGSDVTKLTTKNHKDNVYPAWSPDGTRIVFQSYRDGNPEIYSMNSNGTGLTRLTWQPGYDGTPSWSPDGLKIAFTSDQSGSAGIWVMNWDGSSMTQLDGIPYSYYPSWSPDGSRIAFSADSDNNGWLEIWVMDADGSNQAQMYVPPTNHDSWARSWSPDGYDIAFTDISMIYSHGNWYWTAAYLTALNFTSHSASKIISNNTEWEPDWQSIDMLPPTSSISALPAQSPGPFTVSWSGFDNGPTGIRNYDVQVKETGGEWTDWIMATTLISASYPGIGGHTYAFRVHARDNALNTEAWPIDPQAATTVENDPPISRIHPLNVYTRNGTAIQWGGADPGESGIRTYDIQYRDAAGGGWVDWKVATSLTQDLFTGSAGHTYFFRSRAIDNASNQETWPVGDGDAQTMFYSWGISGKITDNTGIAVTGADIATTPAAYHSTPSDLFGFYRQVVIESLASYQVFWHKDGYGPLPATTYGNEQDAQANIVLPPLDNIIQNHGFESGDTGWTFSGMYSPIITSEVHHTGENAAFIGSGEAAWDSRVKLSYIRAFNLSMGSDEYGNIHAVWRHPYIDPPVIKYAMRSINGTWSEPVTIAESAFGGDLHMLVEPTGIVHVIYQAGQYGDTLMYTWRNQSGVWSTPFAIPGSYQSPGAINFVRDTSGILHLAWVGVTTNTYDPDLYYNRRELDGHWGETYHMIDNYATALAGMAVDAGGNVNFVLTLITPGESGGVYQIVFLQRFANGTWTNPQEIGGNPGYPQMALDPNGMIHLVWVAEANRHGYYIYRDLAGNWSAPEEIPGGNIWGDYAFPSINASRDGHVYLSWEFHNSDQYDLYFLVREPNGNWSTAEKLAEDIVTTPSAAVDSRGRFHIIWADHIGVYYAMHTEAGGWSVPGVLSDASIQTLSVEWVDLYVDDWDQPHVLWGQYSYYVTYSLIYRQAKTISTSGDSTLSQPITVPAQATAPVLSFLYRFDQLYTPPGAGFIVSIQDGQTTTPLLDVGAASLDWTHAWFNLSPWSGKNVTLIFNVHQAANYDPAGVYLDEVSLGAANPDTWVAGRRTTALPGKQATFTFQYGDHGLVPASGELLTVTLPAGLTFVSANIAPISTGITTTNVLVWDIGDLPASSGPFTLEITAALAADIPSGSSLEIPVALTPVTGELETANNSSQATIFVGSLVFMPVTVH